MILLLSALCLVGTTETKSQGLSGAVSPDSKATAVTDEDVTLAQAKRIRQDLLLIDTAVTQYSLDHNIKDGGAIRVKQWQSAIPDDEETARDLKATGKNIFGDSYGDQKADVPPSIPSHTWEKVKTAKVESGFWKEYKPADK